MGTLTRHRRAPESPHHLRPRGTSLIKRFRFVYFALSHSLHFTFQVDQSYFSRDHWDPSEKTLTSSLENSWVIVSEEMIVIFLNNFVKVDKQVHSNSDSTKTLSTLLNFSSQSNSRFTLDDDIDEPLAFVHKSSIALTKRRKNTKEDRYQDKGIQITESSLLYDSEFPPETKVDFLGDDPLFFTEVDDHVQIVSRYRKSLETRVFYCSLVGNGTSQSENS